MADEGNAIALALAEISNKLDVHIAKMDETQRKADLVYKTVITGNGIPSLAERVRQMEARNQFIDKIGWLLGSAVVLDVGMRLWQMIR